jgi:hypothetical protein
MKRYKKGFIAPVQGPITGVFGSQRILNGEPRSPHQGLDFAAAGWKMTRLRFHLGNTVHKIIGKFGLYFFLLPKFRDVDGLVSLNSVFNVPAFGFEHLDQFFGLFFCGVVPDVLFCNEKFHIIFLWSDIFISFLHA